MAKDKKIEGVVKAWRANPADLKIINALNKKLGVDHSQLVRIAIRRLAEAEGLKVA